MPKKTIFAIGLVVVGVVTGVLVLWTYTFTGGSPAMTLVFLGTAVLSIVAGSVLAFSQLIDRFFTPFVVEFSQDIEDDLENLKVHRITHPIRMAIVLVLATLIYSFFVLRFHKVEATWGGIPVVIPAILGVLAVVFLMPRTRWYKDRSITTPFGVFLIPTFGLILSMLLGLSNTENLQILSSRSIEGIQYNAVRGGAFLLNEGSGWAFSIPTPSCDDEVCLVVYLAIALIVLTLVLVIGSAYIPHFWIFSGAILIALMGMIAIHELRFRPRTDPPPVYYPKRH